MRRDPLIIGGGPAGAAAAITLGQAGCRPLLLERTAGPTDKVCGDFLSMDAIGQIRALGVEPAVLGAAPIQRIRLIHGERTAETALPFPACGLSRRALDPALLSQAEAAGAEVRTGCSVRRIVREDGAWTVTSDQASVVAETVFLATGKHDLRDLPRDRTGGSSVGMKMYYALSGEAAKRLEGAIELTLFPGGYAGMQHIENGRVVLCIAVRRRAFQRCGGGWAGLIEAIGGRSRRFAGMLAGARPLLARPLAVAGIPYGYQVRAVRADGLFRLGDQAAVIPSLTGDGMAIALHSGRSAAESWLRGGDSAAYHQGLRRELAPQMRVAGLLHDGCMSGLAQAVMIRGAGWFPSLMRHAAWRTRLWPLAVGSAVLF
jgi:flavin-dependent dehydrogenase